MSLPPLIKKPKSRSLSKEEYWTMWLGNTYSNVNNKLMHYSDASCAPILHFPWGSKEEPAKCPPALLVEDLCYGYTFLGPTNGLPRIINLNITEQVNCSTDPEILCTVLQPTHRCFMNFQWRSSWMTFYLNLFFHLMPSRFPFSHGNKDLLTLGLVNTRLRVEYVMK